MGMFEVTARLTSLVAPDRSSEVSLRVDTGATISWIPEDVLQGLGVQPYSTLPFALADGRRMVGIRRRHRSR